MYKVIFVCLFFMSSLFCQENIGARASALKSYVAIANDVWAIFYNPAGLADLKEREISISYIPAQFGLAELSKKGMAYYEPSLPVKVGVGIEIFGFSLYKESILKLSLAKSFNLFSLGINLNYNFISIKNYGNAGALSADFGFISEKFKFLKFGFMLKHLISGKVGKAGESLPKEVEFGVAFLPYENFTISAEFGKEIYFKENFKYGVEYVISNLVEIRFGVSTYPVRYSGGVGFKVFKFKIDYSVDNHQLLGLTHQITFSAKLSEGK